MAEVFTRTIEDYDKASTLAQQYGGVIAVSCTLYINSDGDFSESKSSLTVNEVQGIKIVKYYNNDSEVDGAVFITSVENALSQNFSNIKDNVYIFCSSGNLSYTGELNFNLWIVDESKTKKENIHKFKY